MNIQKRQSIQKLVIDQAGRDRLILNDLILGFDGAQTVAELIPQYHPGLCHLEVKGNNIDADGFEVLFAALVNCPNLKSIEAEWNSIGTGPGGLEVLCHLVKNLPFLEFVDLKNNRISHQLVDFICQIIEINSKTLKVLDLRWNELGEIGAQAIYRSLAYNSGLKYLGLDDNRISLQSLNQIEGMLKNVARGTSQMMPRQMQTQSVGGWVNTGSL